MQKIATRIFIVAALAFGLLGIAMVIVGPDEGSQQSLFDQVLIKSFMTTVFIILPSFALSVASKYLMEHDK